MSAKPLGSLEAPRPAEQKTVFAPRRSESRPLLALALSLAALLSFIAMGFYEETQPFLGMNGALHHLSYGTETGEANPMGSLGATFAVLMLNAAGWAAFFVPFGLAVFAYYAMFYRAHALIPWKAVFWTVAFFCGAAFLRLCLPGWTPDRFTPRGVGGGLGNFLYERLFGEFLGSTGSFIVLVLLYVVSLCGLFTDDPRQAVVRLLDGIRADIERRREERRIRRAAMMEVRRKQVEALAEARKKISDAKARGATLSVDKVDRSAPAAAPVEASAAAAEPVAVVAEPAKPAKGRGAKAAAAVVAASSAEPAVADPAPGVEEFGEAVRHEPAAPAPPPAAGSRPAGYGMMTAVEPLEPMPLTDDALDMDAPPEKAADDLAPTFSFALTGKSAGPVVAAPDTPSHARPPANPPHSTHSAVVRPEPMVMPAAVAQVASQRLTIVQAEQVERVSGSLTPRVRGDYAFPPVTLLAEPPPAATGPAENYEERADALVRTLGEFKIKVAMGDVQSGPVITRYEVSPAAGVRVEKISGLANNIAMNLKAESVRVLAPVPGKGTVGVEVPNRMPKPVCLREIIESKVWAENTCEIPVVLGKDVTGKPIVADLAKMPHALIAGSTGSGKSVCINGIIASLLYHASPDDLRFIMVDPKVVEMQIYNKLPHMLIPVVTECKKVPGALKWLITEMERRYRIFAKTGVKNIAGFNAKLAKDKDATAKANQLDLALSPEERQAARDAVSVARDDGVLEIPDKKLPYIVCIIDELADLMMVAPADIETGIARIAQLARAAGIHLILATQRPSVNVITGVIKANLPCRIAFKVTSVIDSRTILDQKGAETLIGKGDMLFIPPGAAALVRAQGAYVSEDEVLNLVEYINRKNGDPDFADDVQEAIERAAMEDGDDDKAPTEGTGDDADDPMIAKSWDIIRSTKRASTSMLQRRLSIGYNRAARIMDLLEERGYVGPENGSSPREILKDI